MAYLHEFLELHFLGQVLLGLAGIQSNQCLEAYEFVIFDVGSVLLGKQVVINPNTAARGPGSVIGTSFC
jgi:hypothetical protein